MREEVSIPGLLGAASLSLAATVGTFLAAQDNETGWLSLFAASLVLFFGSLPRDYPRRTGERE